MQNLKSLRAIRACVLAAVPITAVLPQAVMAQSVTLYGAVDAAVISSSNGAPGISSVQGVTSGLLTPSRWGMRGVEDLGDGMKATFMLESGFDSDTGAAKTYFGNPATATAAAPNGTASSGFNRRSTVAQPSDWKAPSAPFGWGATTRRSTTRDCRRIRWDSRCSGMCKP